MAVIWPFYNPFLSIVPADASFARTILPEILCRFFASLGKRGGTKIRNGAKRCTKNAHNPPSAPASRTQSHCGRSGCRGGRHQQLTIEQPPSVNWEAIGVFIYDEMVSGELNICFGGKTVQP